MDSRLYCLIFVWSFRQVACFSISCQIISYHSVYYTCVAPDLVPSRWYVWTGVVASAWVAMEFAAPLSATGARGRCAEHVLGVEFWLRFGRDQTYCWEESFWYSVFDVSVANIITSPPEGVARSCFHLVCVCVCVCLCMCPANILVFYFSAIRRYWPS